jgi:hypothetical protein
MSELLTKMVLLSVSPTTETIPAAIESAASHMTLLEIISTCSALMLQTTVVTGITLRNGGESSGF